MSSDRPNRGYGPTATAWAERLPVSTPILSSDLEATPQAFVDAATRRKRGERFGVAVFIEDPRARAALFLAAPPVLAQVTDYDQRAGLLDALAARALILGGRNLGDIERYDPRHMRSALELLVTADVVVTRSSVERERLCHLLGRRFLHMATVAPPDTTVPAFARTLPGAGSIVVWAPGLAAEACGIFAYALEEFRRPAIIVCAPGQPATMRAGTRFVPVSGAAEALAEAAVIVDASFTDPGAARALARRRVPLAAASCSGAIDWLDGITVYDPWNHRSITAAVANALGYRAPRERRRDDGTVEFGQVLAHATPPLVQGPLISVIVPTMNRRESLRAALASIAAQTYDRVEIVLVNDGGPPFETALIAGMRDLQVIEYAERQGVSAAVNIGIAASHGKYIALLADDDTFCPDHLAVLAAALERTSGDVVHSIELGEHFERAGETDFAVVGHSLINGEPATPTALQTHNVIGGPSILFSRVAFDRVGPFEERAGHLMDLEMWMRMSMSFEFLHVDRVTAVMSMRNDTSQASAVSGPQTAAFYSTIYALHPTSRPTLAAAREKHLHEVEAIPVVRTLPQLRIIPTVGDPNG